MSVPARTGGFIRASEVGMREPEVEMKNVKLRSWRWEVVIVYQLLVIGKEVGSNKWEVFETNN